MARPVGRGLHPGERVRRAMRAAWSWRILRIDPSAGVIPPVSRPAGHRDTQAEHTVDITEVFAWSGKLARDPAPAPPVQSPAPGVQVAPAPAPAVHARAPARAVPAPDAEREEAACRWPPHLLTGTLRSALARGPEREHPRGRKRPACGRSTSCASGSCCTRERARGRPRASSAPRRAASGRPARGR